MRVKVNNNFFDRYLKFKALDRFIFAELVGPFFFGLMAFTIIMVAGGLLFRIADLIIKNGVSLGIVIRLFLYYLPKMAAAAIPMSCLLAALLGFNKLSANSELVALKSSGISFNRIIRPVVILAFFVSIGAFFINETLVPVSERAAANVMAYEVYKQSPPVFKEKVFLREESGGSLKRVIYVNRMDIKDGKMSDVVVQEFESGLLSRLISAEKGEWVNGSWWLEDGKVFEITKENDVSLLFTFDKQALQLNLNPEEAARSSRTPDEMTLNELFREIEMMKQKGMDVSKIVMIMNLRFSVPWACLVLAIVGAAVGSRPQRSSSGMGLGLSVIIVFVYYIILSFTQSLGDAGYLHPVFAAWIANIVFLIIGAGLTLRANRLG
ncbi:MAG: LptF/LptG family permease [Synergistaceae bacterium]|jgi:lipopolysaccharide export system permease protein|nr:LptF/LptG family permease [Synergistaceae bacterium]NLL40675.1 YjgP/YjgQ family permease [Synergistaceae bacterium]